jgi:hypothetical protein
MRAYLDSAVLCRRRLVPATQRTLCAVFLRSLSACALYTSSSCGIIFIPSILHQKCTFSISFT